MTGNGSTAVPETITTLIDWGWAFDPSPDGSAQLVLQSASGKERIIWPMNPLTVTKLRREMMGLEVR